VEQADFLGLPDDSGPMESRFGLDEFQPLGHAIFLNSWNLGLFNAGV
jgi:hypothetical protein